MLLDSHKILMGKGSITEMKSVRYLPPENKEQIYRHEEHTDTTTFTFHVYADLDGLEVRAVVILKNLRSNSYFSF